MGRWWVISALRPEGCSAAYAYRLAAGLAQQATVLFWDVKGAIDPSAKTLAQIYPFRDSFTETLLQNYLKEEAHAMGVLRGQADERGSGLFAWLKSCFDYCVIAAPADWSAEFIALLDFADYFALWALPNENPEPYWENQLAQLAAHRFPTRLGHRVTFSVSTLLEKLAYDPEHFQLSSPETCATQAKNRIHARLLEEQLSSIHSVEPVTPTVLERLVAEDAALPASRDVRDQVLNDLLHDVLGLGPLEPFLRDPEVSEIMVNGPQHLFIEKAGQLHAVDARFESAAQLHGIIDRIVAPIGRRVDESTPLCDARLADGSRVNIVMPPLALDGAVLTIRKFMARRLALQDLIQLGALSSEMGQFLVRCVKARKNILVSGGTGSGKTTLLNSLSGHIAASERIVTIEDAAELKLQQPHVVRLESRPPNAEGQGAISIRRLVMNALRMRPDRIVVGECRGGEALDMLQAMNTGHDGSLTTLHANSPRDALGRLETLVLMAGMELPIRVIREQIRSAVHVIVQVARLASGQRKVTSITELTGLEGEVLTTAELFRYHEGQFEHTGLVSQHALD